MGWVGSGKGTKPEALKEMGKNSQFLLKIGISILKQKPEQRFHGPPLPDPSLDGVVCNIVQCVVWVIL